MSLSLGLSLSLRLTLTQTMRKMLDSDCSLEGLQRAGYYLLHRALQRRAAQERGIALVLDFKGFSLSQLYAVRWEDLRRGVAMLQECFPARLCSIYVLNEPRWLLLLVKLLRPLLSQDSMQQKFKLCGTAAWSKCSLGTAPARLLRLLRARLTALDGSALPGRGRATGRSASASGARASRLRSRLFHGL